MSNMSYCRFQNTSSDLADCHSALEALLSGEDKLSREELASAKALAITAFEIVLLLAEASGQELRDLEDAHLRQALDNANNAAAQ